MKRSLFELWTNRKEEQDYVKKSNQLKLSPSQLTRLQGDSGVRDALENSRLAPLLPPVGTDVFRRFSPASLEKIKHEQEKRKISEGNEEHLLKPTPELEAEKTLPFFYGDPPPELLNTPLEDLDPYYQSKKTFIVLSKGNTISRFDAGSACLQLSPLSLLRRLAIKTLNQSFFHVLLLVALLFNCVLMVFEDPPVWTYYVDCVFMGIFILEAVLKIMSRGFCVGSFTYIRDPWNWLDMIIIILGLANLVFQFDLRMFPTVSAPRILKIIPLICDLKKAVGTILKFVAKLTDFFIFTLFIVTIVAMTGLHSFMGSLRNKCILSLPPSNLTHYADDHDSFDFHAYINNATNYYFIPGQLDALLCGNYSDAGMCPEGFTCMRGGQNPNYSLTSFDNFGWALLTVFRLLAMDFWENLAMLVMRAQGKPTLLFFIITIFICSFGLVALFLATVTMMFLERDEETFAKAKQKQEDFNEIMGALNEDKDSQRAEDEDIKDSKTGKKCGCSACCSAPARLLCSWNCCSCWRKVKQGLSVLVNDPFFDLVIIITLIINCIFMAMEHFPMTYEFEWMLSVGELAFMAIYTAEMLLKILATDPYTFFQRNWNIFDSVLVLVSWVHMVVYFDIMYLYTTLRVVRLARWWGSFSKWLRMVRSGFRSVWTLALALVIFFFSLTGKTLFQYHYSSNVCRIAADCELPRFHMADFFHTFIIVTRGIYGEWLEVLWDCAAVSNIFSCLAFFVFLKIIGHLIVMGLFLYLLKSWFSRTLEVPEEEKCKILKERLYRVVGPLIHRLVGEKNQENPVQHAAQTQPDKKKEYVALTFVPSDEPASELKDPTVKNGTETSTLPIGEAEKLVQKVKDDEEDPVNTPENCCSDKCYSCCPLLDIDTSQGIGKVWSIFRKTCIRIIQHRYFENIFTFIIILSCFFLVFEDIYLATKETLKQVVDNADTVFTYLFVLEMLLKWVSHGFRKYFTNGWCCFDFIITILLLISTSAEMAGAGPSLRYLRALRPLKVLYHIQGTKLSVVVLLRLIPVLMDALLVSLVVWLMFGIIGTSIFAGKFSYCFNETSEEYFLPEVVANKTQCFELIEANFSEVRWKNVHINFDNMQTAYVALLQVATFKGSFDILYAASDSSMVESQPAYEENVHTFLFFFLFQIFGCFFVFSFIVKALFDAYKQQREKIRSKFFLTEKQKKFYNAVKTLNSSETLKHPPRPENKFQGWIYDLVTSLCFEVFMVLIICANIVAMLIESYDMSLDVEAFLYWFHFTIILIFVFECILKIIAFRRLYFSNTLNVIDFLVTIMSILGMILRDLMEKYFITYFYPLAPGNLVVFRLGRVACILHHIPGTKRIRMLFTAFMMSLPSVFNIGLLLFVIMYTFTSFATFHFGNVKEAGGVDDMFNFETFGSSITLMCMATTWAGWDSMLFPMLAQPPDCDPFMQHEGTTVTGNCGNPQLAMAFFITYLVVASFLILNMFIVVIMEVLNMFAETNRDPLNNNNLKMFRKTWKKFDPDTTYFIDYSKLSDFCNALQEPLRIPKPNSVNLIHMDLPLHPGDKIHCQDVLFALSAQVLGESAELDTLKDSVKEKFQMFMANPCKESCEPVSSTLHRKQEEVAASVIQRAFRKRHLQQPLNNED